MKNLPKRGRGLDHVSAVTHFEILRCLIRNS